MSGSRTPTSTAVATTSTMSTATMMMRLRFRFARSSGGRGAGSGRRDGGHRLCARRRPDRAHRARLSVRSGVCSHGVSAREDTNGRIRETEASGAPDRTSARTRT